MTHIISFGIYLFTFLSFGAAKSYKGEIIIPSSAQVAFAYPNCTLGTICIPSSVLLSYEISNYHQNMMEVMLFNDENYEIWMKDKSDGLYIQGASQFHTYHARLKNFALTTDWYYVVIYNPNNIDIKVKYQIDFSKDGPPVTEIVILFLSIMLLIGMTIPCCVLALRAIVRKKSLEEQPLISMGRTKI